MNKKIGIRFIQCGKCISFILLSILVEQTYLSAQIVPLNNSNFKTAVELWFTDEANAKLTYGHIKDWNVTAVTSMQRAFKDRSTFNEDISAWNVGNVKNMYGMFSGATSFNQPLNNWVVSKVKSMNEMFYNAHSFNQDISDWNISNVQNINGIFCNATSFNQDITCWNIDYNILYQDPFININVQNVPMQ